MTLPLSLAALTIATGLITTTASAEAAATPATVASGIDTTVDGGSNLRRGPHLNSHVVGTTKGKSEFAVQCYERGDYYNDGKYRTDFWYYGTVFDKHDNPEHVYYGVYSWGGNVNTPHDPPAGLSKC
ncbi:hypothetical protein [Streptomyces sp. NPDC046759]|uniref:hypothetical protein n=1 Tax=Streptomyces sp. NPDC046759 TaxID=3155019 RepID=UPI003403468C